MVTNPEKLKGTLMAVENNILKILREHGGSMWFDKLVYLAATEMTGEQIIPGYTGPQHGSLGAEGTAEIYVRKLVEKGKLDHSREDEMVKIVENANDQMERRTQRHTVGERIREFSPTRIVLDNGTIIDWSRENGSGAESGMGSWLVVRLNDEVIYRS